MGFYKRKITVRDDEVTSAVHLTLKQSLVPCFLGMSHFVLLKFHLTNMSPQSRFSSSSSKQLMHSICTIVSPILISPGVSHMDFLMFSIPISRNRSTSRPPNHPVFQPHTLAHTSSAHQLSAAGCLEDGVSVLRS